MKSVIIYSALMVILGALLFAQYNSEINVSQSPEEKTNQETLTNETSETNNNNQTISISEVFKIQLKEIDEEVPKEYEVFKEYFDRYFSNDIAINDFLISSGVATDRIETNILNTNTKETNENQKKVTIEDIDKIEFKVLPEDIEDIIKEEIENKRKFRKLEKQPLAIEIESAETKIYASGDITFGISFGSVRKTPDLKTPISSFIKENFNVDQDMKIRSTSKIGNKVDVDIEFDQKSAINKFNVSYKEPETQDLPQQLKETSTPPSTSTPSQTKPTQPFVKELTFGDVRFTKQGSRYVNYTAVSSSAQGIKFVGSTDKFYIEAIGTLATSVPAKKTFIGRKSTSGRQMRDIDYIKRKYFKLPDSNIDKETLEVYLSTTITTPDIYIDGIPFRRLVEGNDFIFDNFNNEIELRNSIDRSTYLAVFYTHDNGQPITISTNIYQGLGNNGKTYLYLFNPSIGYSPYEMKNIYPLGSFGIELSQIFEIKVYMTIDPNILAPINFTEKDFEIIPQKGIIKFKNLYPFTNLIVDFYSLNREPIIDDSTYTLSLKFYETITSYQLDFDIVEGSEEVRINGVLIPKEKYTIYYPIGRIIFKDPTLINEGDTIEISYEYKPLFGGPQKISLGSIAEYKLTDYLSSTFSLAFWSSQATGSAPRISSAPPLIGFIGGIINSFDIKKFLGIDNKNFDSKLNIEYGFSFVNPNSFGAAIVEDFDSSKKSYLLSDDEEKWYLSSPDTNIGCYQTNRGILYYKDYRQYGANESFTLMSYTWNIPSEQILPYSQKPGPYLVAGGRLNPSEFPNVSQTSLVFDYDFSQGTWVGAILPISSSGIDLSDIQEIIVWYKMQMDNNSINSYDDNNTNSIEIHLQFGKFSEDLDGDGILDQELSTSQDGFEFNNPINGSLITKIGGGRKGGGNGNINSEDLNKNGRLDTEESFVSFSTNLSGSGWKQLVIQVNTLSAPQVEILRRVQAVRIILKKLQGIKGRILIDEIQIKSRTSRTYKVDGIKLYSPYQISASTISIYDSPLYLKNRFFNIEGQTKEEKERTQEYSYLHGTSTLSVSEAKSIDESSLRITYNLSNVSINTNFSPYTGGREGTVVINFDKSQNYSSYSKFIFYVFIPTLNDIGVSIKTNGDTFSDENIVLRLVSKEDNYFEWIIPIERLKKDYWNRLEIRIKENAKLIINDNIYDTVEMNINKFPTWRDLTFMEIGIRVNSNSTEPVNSGEIWLNEIYLTGVNWEFSSALNSEFQLNYKDNLLTIGNFPIFSDFNSRLFIENIFPNFRGNGGKEAVNNFNLSLYSRFNLIKYLNVDNYFSTTRENTVEDPTLPVYLFSTNSSTSFKYTIQTAFDKEYLPGISYSFSDRLNYSLQNGIFSAPNNQLFIQTSSIDEISLDSSINIVYKIPFLTMYNLNFLNTFNVNSSYYVKNYDTRTNNIYFFSSPSYENWIYGISLNSSLSYPKVNINNNFSHSETFINTVNSTINKATELKESGIVARNIESLKLLSEGFVERGSRREVKESDTLSIVLQGIINNLNAYITPAYDFRDFNFRYISNSIYRDSQMNGKITYKFDLNIGKYQIDTISFGNSFNTEVYINSLSYNIKWYDIYTNNLYRGVVAIPFYDYIDIWNENNLMKALELVSNIYYINSTINELANINLTISLKEFENLLLSIIPRNYLFDYSTKTSREISSFRQSTKLSFSFNSYIPIYKLDWFIFRRSEDISISEISTGFSFSRQRDFNSRIINDSYSISSAVSGKVSTQQNYSLSLDISYSPQDIITNLPSFHSNYGIGLYTPQALQSKISLLTRFYFSYTLPSNSDIDLIFTKLRVNSSLENREEISFYTEKMWHNTNSFIPFKRKVFEIDFQHSTEINFSDYIRGKGYFKFLLGQMSEVYTEFNEVKEKLFDLIPGVEVGLNVRITF
jgi:hypothetical protein